MLETASPLEVAWTCIGLLALTVALWNLMDALTDWRWVWDVGAPVPLRRVARTALVRAALWGLKAGLLVWVGVAAMLLPPAPAAPPAASLTVAMLRLSTIAALILVALLMTGMIALEAWERRTWRRTQATGPEPPP